MKPCLVNLKALLHRIKIIRRTTPAGISNVSSTAGSSPASQGWLWKIDAHACFSLCLTSLRSLPLVRRVGCRDDPLPRQRAASQYRLLLIRMSGVNTIDSFLDGRIQIKARCEMH
jgi:hypothetical protein